MNERAVVRKSHHQPNFDLRRLSRCFTSCKGQTNNPRERRLRGLCWTSGSAVPSQDATGVGRYRCGAVLVARRCRRAVASVHLPVCRATDRPNGWNIVQSSSAPRCQAVEGRAITSPAVKPGLVEEQNRLVKRTSSSSREGKLVCSFQREF